MPFTVGPYLKVAKGMRKYAKWLFKDIYLVAPIIPRLNVDGVKHVWEWGDETLEAPPERRPAKRDSSLCWCSLGWRFQSFITPAISSGSTWNTDPPPREDEEALSMLFEVEATPNEGPFEPLLLEDDELEPGLLPPELPPRLRRRHLVGGSWGI
ncbi:hypothetical protein JB92DRAFT_2837625 [Gautieria morchelliformis]|nr:hypothetical protein JB92DRAFT_2837625 [Gautieria morchelliformis]